MTKEIAHFLLTPFIINPNNIGNSLTPKEFRSRINGQSMSMDSLTLDVLVEGKVKIYLCPQGLDQLLGQPNHNSWNSFYAFDSDLFE